MIPRRLSEPDDTPGTSSHTLSHDGRERSYRVHVPPILPLGAPLVIQLHGGGGNGTGLDRLTRFYDLADRERFAVASPNGVDHRWHDGRTRRQAAAGQAPEPVDDVGFLAALIDCVAGWLPIDRRRVYVAGISNGAMMAARLANEIPDRIAAFGQVAGTVAEDAPTWWHPARPVPVIQIHGTADPIIPYQGGAVKARRRGGADRDRVLGVEEWVALVAAHNGATGPTDVRIEGDITQSTWRGPTAQGDVEAWQVAGGGHTWPGGRQYLPVGIIGTTTATFDATAALWRFFANHSL
ncbi:MAG: polyhydroxybutyrate depolymerase [Acidimicrobiaceae bacterium]|nr:polyhydroxybutyrate depolymerase [Acidimicrobiaceae bacterium]